MIQFDHARLVNRHPTEVARFRRHVLGLQPGQVDDAVVMHEHDNSCCAREPWAVTEQTIARALSPNTELLFVDVAYVAEPSEGLSDH
jgi:hypothetical protein